MLTERIAKYNKTSIIKTKETLATSSGSLCKCT